MKVKEILARKSSEQQTEVSKPGLVETKHRILQLIKEAEAQFAGTGKAILDIEDYVAEYLAANGVIAPPCKVGDTVYSIIGKNVQPFVVVCSNIQLVAEETSFEYKAENGEYPMYFGGRDIDKTVFLTR